MTGRRSEVDIIVLKATATLRRYVESEVARRQAVDIARGLLAPEVIDWLNALCEKPDSYRDALLVVLAVPLVRGMQVDITQRTDGGRSASGKIGRLLAELHIRGVDDAYQNIAKNSRILTRGNNPVFDQLLRWCAATADLNAIEAAYDYVSAAVAATARIVEPCPSIRPASLKFAAVMALFEEMLRLPSGGAHEQYIVAALIEAAAEGAYRVQTKRVSVSDSSAGVAGDIQVFGQLMQESIEVSANPWRTKEQQARATKQRYDLPRTHIIAQVRPDEYVSLDHVLDVDISVIDIRAAISTLLAFLTRQQREAALVRLYELLDVNLPSPELVNRYATRLRDRGLAT
jgi:hypothetical protein